MRIIIIVHVLISLKVDPSAVSAERIRPVPLHGCEGGVHVLDVCGVIGALGEEGEGPEGDGDGLDDVAVQGERVLGSAWGVQWWQKVGE